MPRAQSPLLRGQCACQHTQQRGFTHAVKTDQRNFLSVADIEIHIAQNPAFFVVGKVHVFDRHDLRPAVRRRWNPKFREAVRGCGRTHHFELFEHFNAALHQRGFGGFGAEAVDKTFEMFFLLDVVAVGGGLLQMPLLTLFEIVGVAAGIFNRAPAADFDRAVGEVFEQIAVMRNEQHGAIEAAQKTLQPFDGRQVEIVRRFVEHQDVGLCNQCAHQLGAHLPSSAERPERIAKFTLLKTESAERGFSAGFHVVAAEVFKVVLQIPQTVEHLFLFRAGRFQKIVFQLMDLGLNGFELRNGVGGVVQHGAILRVSMKLLMQMTDPHVFRKRHLAAVGRQLVGDQAEDGTFARPIGADHADMLARIDAERDIIEHLLGTEALADLNEIDHGRRV